MAESTGRVEYEVHVVSHTHWDREWYRPFENFRFRLVRLVDRLIALLDTDPEYHYYMLDGQTIVLEDYLEIRPDAEEALRRHVQSGRLLIGPWYILPDEFLVSGESTIRNMLIGWRVARRFGEPMKIGYIPDTFGHLPQMPQILRGFGIDTAVFWRGLSGPPERVRSEFYWQAPDGSTVLGLHLPDEYGYSSLAELPADVESAVDHLRQRVGILGPHATSQYILLMNGTDHLEPRPDLPALLRQANLALAGEARLVHSTLPALFEKLKAAASADGTRLEVYRQAFRDTNRKLGPRYNFILPAVLSARIYLKQQNQECETALERWAEPFGAMASKVGGGDLCGFCDYAWRLLLQNHPHDSICGCSVDEVHSEMETRFLKVGQVTGEVIEGALQAIAYRVDVESHEADSTALVVFNPLGWPRDDLVQATVETRVPYVRGVEVRDETGALVPARVVRVEPTSVLPPTHGRGSLATIAFPAKGVPALGYQTYTVRVLDQPARVGSSVVVGPRRAENEHLLLEVNSDGSLTLTDKVTGHVYPELNVFEDGGDVGDEYVYGPPIEDRIVYSTGQSVAIGLADDGPAKATFVVEYDLWLPEGEADPSGQARSERLISNRVKSWVTLAAGSRRVDVETRVENHSKDHRLRVLFPSGVPTEVSYAESAFDVVAWPTRVEQPTDGWIEPQPTFYPQASFVDVNDSGHGLAVANRGLPEYEVKPDGTIALTLLRAVGWLGRISTGINLNAGPHLATPDAQCLRTLTFNYSIIPHTETWLESGAHREAHAHLAPLRAIQVGRPEHDFSATRILEARPPRDLPRSHSFLDLGSGELILSAVRRSEDGRAVIVRAFNPADRTVRASVRPGFAFGKVSLANLAEEAQGEVTPDAAGRLALQVPAHRIVTLRFE